ncbi:MAG: hypothetical protein ABIW32_10050 [Terrimesophilobacter sp.]
MTTFDFAGASLRVRPERPGVPARRDITLVQLHDDLWRVTRRDGEVLGYVEGFSESRGRRFRSKRLIVLRKTFVPLGEFWNFDDAVDCLRFG